MDGWVNGWMDGWMDDTDMAVDKDLDAPLSLRLSPSRTHTNTCTHKHTRICTGPQGSRGGTAPRRSLNTVVLLRLFVCMYVYAYLHILMLHVRMFFTHASAVRAYVCLAMCQTRICMLATRMCLYADTNRSCSFAACPHFGCMTPGPVSKSGTSSALGQHRGACVRA